MAEKTISEFFNYIIGGTLLCLTLATYLLAMLDLGVWNLIVALFIAAMKASLIILYFMRARYSERLIWAVIGCGLLWMGILFSLTLSDYLLRQ